MQGAGYNVLDLQLVSIFLDDYFPTEAFKVQEAPSAWIKIALAVPEPGSSLRLALQALCRSRAGLARGDESMKVAGFATYTKALRKFREKLADDGFGRSDETLATARAFSLYEVMLPLSHSCKL